MARKNATKVIGAFLLGESAVGDSKRTIHTDGVTLYSYRMPIAKHVSDGVLLVSYKSAPSATTRSQVRACEMLIPNPIRVEHIEDSYHGRGHY